MSRLDDTSPEFQSLLAAACREDVSPEQLQALEEMAANPAAIRMLVDYLLLDAELQRLVRGQTNADKCLANLGFNANTGADFLVGEGLENEKQGADSPELSESLFPGASFDPGSHRPSFALPPISLDPCVLTPAPPRGLFGAALHGTTDFISENHVVFSYAVATVCIAFAAFVGSLMHVSHEADPLMARQSAPPDALHVGDEREFVGRITGMNDCRWSDPDTITYAGASVPLGRKYALSSGLMEITYRNGAKVILEGPCSYEVDARDGGYLGLGKLTARVDIAKPQAVKTQDPRPKTQDQNPQSLSSLIPHSSSLFTVRTPTAVVTDLGTEFGVEVGEEGNTTSYVFRGSIRVEGEGGGKESVVLRENESVRVGRVRETHHETGENVDAVRFTHPATPPRFVRAIPQTKRGFIDLADIVAGGDGFGRARQRGIDSSAGTAIGGTIGSFGAEGDGRYHRVDGMPLVDGVFVPDGGPGPVQLDSAGHVCSTFPNTDNFTWGYIWSGEYPQVKEDIPSPTCWLGGVNYSRTPHSVLCMPANKGITFDLKAIRRTDAELNIRRFTAVAGNTEQRTLQGDPRYERVSADVWVFVDGRIRFRKMDFNSEDGPLPIDVALTPADRFLTLAATDAGNTANFDWTMFGDPRLEIGKAIENRKEAVTPQP